VKSAASDLIKSIAAAISVRGLIGLVNRTAAAAEELQDLSTKLGLTTEFFSEMQFAADQLGVEWGEFTGALQAATVRMEEFRQSGKGTAKDALQLLGGGLAEAVRGGKNLEELLPQIADRFRALSDDQRRVQVAFDLFGRGGTSMVNVLKGGAMAITELRERARELGITLETEAAAELAGLKDQMDELRAAGRALGRQFVELAGPAVKAMAAGGSVALKALDTLMEDLIEVTEELFVQWEQGFSIAGGDTAAEMRERYRAMQAESARLRREGERAPLPYRAGEYLAPLMGPPMPEPSLDIFSPLARGWDTILDTSRTKLGELVEATAAGGEEMRSSFQGALDLMSQEHVLWAESFRVTLTDVLNAASGLIYQTGASIGSAFASWIFDSQEFSEAMVQGLKQTAKSFITTLVQLGIQQLAYLVLSLTQIGTRLAAELKAWSAIVWASAFAASSSTGLAGVFAAPGVAAAAVAAMLAGAKVSSAAGAATAGTIVPMAEGGIVRRPTIALIGEAGPERVEPLRPGMDDRSFTFILDLDGNSVARAMVERIPRLLRAEGRL
jgi:hypothetical protein